MQIGGRFRSWRFGLFGAGFWSRFQLAGWMELDGVECVAICDRTRSKAQQLADAFGVAAVYDDPSAMLESEQMDFVDICTSADTHPELTFLSARRGLPVVCQKPLAGDLRTAEQMVDECRRAGVLLCVNENWRWQTPIRAIKGVLDAGRIGRPFRGRLRMVSGFPVFENQPFLRELDQFLLVDIGSHILDVARFLFGEAESIFCQTARVQPAISGEDVATLLLRMQSAAVITCEMGYPGSPHEDDSFPETYIFIEGDRGSVSLSRNYRIRIVDRNGVEDQHARPPHYPWADAAYDVVHSSIVPCQRDILAGLRGEKSPETTGEDNLQTVRLVHAAYVSAASGDAVRL